MAPLVQPLHQAVEVSGMDQLNLLLFVLSVEGAAGTGFQLELLTGMSTESEDGWVSMGIFSAVTMPNKSEKKDFSGPLKYVRWKVLSLGTFTAVTFSLRGMGRSN